MGAPCGTGVLRSMGGGIHGGSHTAKANTEPPVLRSSVHSMAGLQRIPDPSWRSHNNPAAITPLDHLPGTA